MVAEHPYQAGDREPDQDQVLDERHARLGARGDPDADDRDDEHDEADGGADRDVRPGARGQPAVGVGDDDHLTPSATSPVTARSSGKRLLPMRRADQP
jgi:hypothetical protein